MEARCGEGKSVKERCGGEKSVEQRCGEGKSVEKIWSKERVWRRYTMLSRKECGGDVWEK